MEHFLCSLQAIVSDICLKQVSSCTELILKIKDCEIAIIVLHTANPSDLCLQ